MSKRKKIILFGIISVAFFVAAFLAAYRYIGVGGRVFLISADSEKGFYSEYYLFIPDTYKKTDGVFLLVEPNNTGSVDDDHQTHKTAAHDMIRFGQSNQIAQELGAPLLVPCFDRPETNWERYTHALDRDTLLTKEGALARIDYQLLAMIKDARTHLAEKDITTKEKVLLNGFSASGSFVNRFTVLHPEMVAGTAAGGINSLVILPDKNKSGQELLYPVGVADLEEITGLPFQLQQFAAVPQYYYMGENDENDALQFDDAYSDSERDTIIQVLGKDMNLRWENCEKYYVNMGVRAVFLTYSGVAHETTTEINQDIVDFFKQVIKEFE